MTRMDSGMFLESRDFLFYAAPYSFSTGENVSSHSHDFFELAYVAQGQGSITIRESTTKSRKATSS